MDLSDFLDFNFDWLKASHVLEPRLQQGPASHEGLLLPLHPKVHRAARARRRRAELHSGLPADHLRLSGQRMDPGKRLLKAFNKSFKKRSGESALAGQDPFDMLHGEGSSTPVS